MRAKLSLERIPKSDVLVLNLHLSQFLLHALEGINYSSVDLAIPTVILRPKFIFHLIFQSRGRSRLARWLVALSRSSGSKVIIAMDNFNVGHHHPEGMLLLDELSELLPEVSILAVQHGQELRRRAIVDEKSLVTLLSWGAWTAENFPRFGRSEQHFSVVGPLVDGLYRSVRPTGISKDISLVIVSTVKDETWWGNEVGERRQGYEVLIAYLAKFLNQNKLRAFVALTIDRDQNQSVDEAILEKNWFVERLGDLVEFSDPTKYFGNEELIGTKQKAPSYVKERYSTYYLCDRSVLTVGMSSTVLWESFGRGNKILSVNTTNNSSYDFPVPGVWSLVGADYKTFDERMNYLLRLTEEEWRRLSRESQTHLVHYDPTEPPHMKIRNFVVQAIRNRMPKEAQLKNLDGRVS